MKKSNVKSPRKKAIPQCFKKKSKSNVSLSKLLHIASYKKRINDLVYNNRRLARELQNARCEVAAQSKMLEKNANDRNLIMFAQLKMKDMAQTVTKLVSDMDEVRSCLDNFDFASNEVKFQTTKGFPCRKAVPAFDAIEEVSILSGSDSFPHERTPSPPILQIMNIPAEPSANERGASFIEMEIDAGEGSSANDFPLSDALPGILFVEEHGNPEELDKRQKSSKKKSSVFKKSDQRSVTPELDMDFPIYPHKKSSTRRQTQLFKVSDSRRTKSKENVISPEATPAISSKTSSNESINRCENVTPEDNKEEYLQISPVLPHRTAKSASSHDCLHSVMPESTVLNVVTNVSQGNMLPVEKPNCGLLPNEDMERIDISSLIPVNFTNASSAVHSPCPLLQTSSDSDGSEHFDIASKNKSDLLEKGISPKFKETPKRKSSILGRGSRNFIADFSDRSINVDVIHTSSPAEENEDFENCENIQPLLLDSFKTPSPSKKSRRKQVKHACLPNDSEECDTPNISKSQTKSRYSIVKDRMTAIFIPKKQVEDVPADCLSFNSLSRARKSVLKSPATPRSPASEFKRVSFATTDTICNFKKMSVSKTIAESEKVSWASKSVSEIEDALDQGMVESLTVVDNSTKDTGDDNDDLYFNFDEETEMYACSSPVNPQCPEEKTMNQKPSPKAVLPLRPQTEGLNICDENSGNKMDLSRNVKVTDVNKNKKETNLNRNEKETHLKKSKKGSDKNKKESIKETDVQKTSNASTTGTTVSCQEKPRKLIPLFNMDAVSKRIKTPSLKAKTKISDSKENLNEQDTATVKSTKKSKERISKRSAPILSLESSPVLKDTMNLESKSSLTRKASGISSSGGDAVIEIPKRRSKPVSYVEPKLNKKMRRE